MEIDIFMFIRRFVKDRPSTQKSYLGGRGQERGYFGTTNLENKEIGLENVKFEARLCCYEVGLRRQTKYYQRFTKGLHKCTHVLAAGK